MWQQIKWRQRGFEGFCVAGGVDREKLEEKTVTQFITHKNNLLIIIRIISVPAHVAVDAFFGNQQCHFSYLLIGAHEQARNLS
ncbi:TPA: hypothetical protein QH712_003899 [Serratia liquefaciens]|uniref:hypothetical protein n=1 Tax=Serratia liquefaciens TaxID=614 RepID=UPI0021BD55B2|nr:hypothetical protein [Serratia liquefaciens]HDS8360256.1 hypothetical protein [Serratia liquefaciens]